MIDHSRPAAPYLPPEIISRILHYVHSQPSTQEHLEFSNISEISYCWYQESQKRLLGVVQIKSFEKLQKLLEIRESGRLLFMKRLSINLKYTRPLDANAIFLPLQFCSNLKFLDLKLPSDFNFYPSQSAVLRSDVLLPHLSELHLGYYYNGNETILDEIIGTSPNLTTLNLTGRFRSPKTIARSTLTNLKHLFMKDGEILMNRDFWPLLKFQKLETLELENCRALDKIVQFFELIGPTLLELKLPSSCISPGFPSDFFQDLVQLKKLEIPGFISEELLMTLPPSITELVVSVLRDVQPSGWNHLVNLKVLEINQLFSGFNRYPIPRLTSLTIKEAEKDHVLGMLELIEAGAETLEVLILDKSVKSVDDGTRLQRIGELSDDVDIQACCKDLGIKLVKFLTEDGEVEELDLEDDEFHEFSGSDIYISDTEEFDSDFYRDPESYMEKYEPEEYVPEPYELEEEFEEWSNEENETVEKGSRCKDDDTSEEDGNETQSSDEEKDDDHENLLDSDQENGESSDSDDEEKEIVPILEVGVPSEKESREREDSSEIESPKETYFWDMIR